MAVDEIATTATATPSSTACGRRARLPHRRRVVLRPVAVADRRRARRDAARGLVRRRPARGGARGRRAQGRGGRRRGGARRASPSRTSGSSRSSPTSGSTRYVLLAARGLAPVARRGRARPPARRSLPAPDPFAADYRRVPFPSTTTGSGSGRAPARTASALRAARRRVPAELGYVVFDRDVRPVPDAVRVSGHGAAGRLRRERRGGETAAFVPEFEVARVEAETSFDRIESYPEYPGTRAPDADPRARAGRHGHHRDDRRRRGRLPGDPRLPGPDPRRGDRRDGRPARALARAADGDQERRTRSSSSARARGGASTRTGCSSGTPGPARPRRRRACARATRRASPCSTRSAPTYDGGLSSSDGAGPATAARSARGAPGRTPWRTTSSSGRATSW